MASARYGLALKSADAAAPAALGAAIESHRALGLSTLSEPGSTSATSPDNSKARLAQYAGQNQFVGAKNFFRNDQQWIDGDVQQNRSAKLVRIQFGSAEYFNLIAKDASVLPWLALGQNVQFVLDHTIYDIYE